MALATGTVAGRMVRAWAISAAWRSVGLSPSPPAFRPVACARETPAACPCLTDRKEKGGWKTRQGGRFGGTVGARLGGVVGLNVTGLGEFCGPRQTDVHRLLLRPYGSGSSSLAVVCAELFFRIYAPRLIGKNFVCCITHTHFAGESSAVQIFAQYLLVHLACLWSLVRVRLA